MKEKRGAKRENRRRERREGRKTMELCSQVWFDQISKQYMANGCKKAKQ